MVTDDSEIEMIRKRKIEAAKEGAKPKEPEVIVYSSPACRYCTMAKAYLADKGVKFTDYDVSKDRQRAEEMIMKTGQGAVPVLQINGRMIVGFDRQQIDVALSRAPPPRRDVALGNIIYDPFNF